MLKDVVILFQVIYNVDGHENRSAFMRINQNGPDEMGYRANATNLNLNRDYMKADAPETRAWLRLWNDWRPDLFIDCHVTNGADFQYNLTYEYAHFQEVSPSVKAWMDEHFDGVVVPKVEKEGNLLTHYVEFAGREITGGIATFVPTPRFATGYTAIRDRAGLLIETHVYKPYKSRSVEHMMSFGTRSRKSGGQKTVSPPRMPLPAPRPSPAARLTTKTPVPARHRRHGQGHAFQFKGSTTRWKTASFQAVNALYMALSRKNTRSQDTTKACGTLCRPAARVHHSAAVQDVIDVLAAHDCEPRRSQSRGR